MRLQIDGFDARVLTKKVVRIASPHGWAAL